MLRGSIAEQLELASGAPGRQRQGGRVTQNPARSAAAGTPAIADGPRRFPLTWDKSRRSFALWVCPWSPPRAGLSTRLDGRAGDHVRAPQPIARRRRAVRL